MGFNRFVRDVLSGINDSSIPIRGDSLILFKFRKLFSGFRFNCCKPGKLSWRKYELFAGLLRKENAQQKTIPAKRVLHTTLRLLDSTVFLAANYRRSFTGSSWRLSRTFLAYDELNVYRENRSLSDCILDLSYPHLRANSRAIRSVST